MNTSIGYKIGYKKYEGVLEKILRAFKADLKVYEVYHMFTQKL